MAINDNSLLNMDITHISEHEKFNIYDLITYDENYINKLVWYCLIKTGYIMQAKTSKKILISYIACFNKIILN